jgi:CheY-like chemotaxis protein
MRPINILVVDDDDPKLKSICNFLLSHISKKCNILTANSLSGAVRVLSENDIFFAIIDMSIPTFDFGRDTSGGGQPQGFGGSDILRFIKIESPKTFSVVITQYEEFPAQYEGDNRNIHTLRKELNEEISDNFYGVIHYADQHGEWQKSLLSLIQKLDLDEK